MLLALQILLFLTGALIALTVLFGVLTEVARKSQNQRLSPVKPSVKTSAPAQHMIHRRAA
jgi:hypothetical protein